MSKSSTTKIDIAVINANIIDIKEDVKEIKEKLDSNYVTKEEFDPIKKIVYGLISIILTAVIGGLLSLVLIK